MRQKQTLDIESGFKLLRLNQDSIRANCDTVRYVAEHSKLLSQPEVEWADTVNHTGTDKRSSNAKLELDS